MGLAMEQPGRFFRLVIRKPLTPMRAGRAIALATTIVTIVCGVVMRLVDPADFGNVWVALWWAVQTVTTVGYCDEVPRHTGGRVVGAVLMLMGIGFLSVVTAAITAALIETARQRLADPGQARLQSTLDDVSARLQRVEAALERDRD
jgi:voltage-gated potassium channel